MNSENDATDLLTAACRCRADPPVSVNAKTPSHQLEALITNIYPSFVITIQLRLWRSW